MWVRSKEKVKTSQANDEQQTGWESLSMYHIQWYLYVCVVCNFEVPVRLGILVSSHFPTNRFPCSNHTVRWNEKLNRKTSASVILLSREHNSTCIIVCRSLCPSLFEKKAINNFLQVLFCEWWWWWDGTLYYIFAKIVTHAGCASFSVQNWVWERKQCCLHCFSILYNLEK